MLSTMTAEHRRTATAMTQRRGRLARAAHVLLVAAVSIVAMLAVHSAAAGPTSLARRASTCNGDSLLCNREYSNVTFAGAHDSYAINAPGQTSIAANQNVSVATQLNAGTRMLQVQAHKSSNSSATGAGIDLCHTSCQLFQGGSLEYFLGQVETWVSANPNDVVTLLIVNSDGLPSTQFAQAFQSTGLANKMWSPSNDNYNISRNQWPTLGDMIDSGKTVVGFLATGAETSSVNYLLDEFVNMWETPYDQVSTPFNCSVDRIGTSVSNPTSIMYVLNMFLDTSLGDFGTIPDVSAIGTTNSQASTLSTASNCASEHNQRYPNFILTDYSTAPNYGLQRAVAQMNGVSYTAPKSSGSSSSSGSSGASRLLAGSALGSAATGIVLLVVVAGLAM